MPIFGPAPKVYVLAQGSTSSGSGCFALPLGSCDLSVSPCSSPAKGGQEDKGPKDQGNPNLSSVAHSTVVGVAAGHDGGTSNAASTLQDNPGDSGQHSCCPLPRSSGSSACYRQEFRLSKTSLDLAVADLDFLPEHLAPQSASGYGYTF